MTVTALHAVVAVLGWLLLRQTLTGDGFVVRAPDPLVAETFATAALTASALASAATIWAGRVVWRPRIALAAELASLAFALWPLGVMWLGPWTLELGGFFLVVLIAARVFPAAVAVFAGGSGAAAAFVATLAAYAGATIWATQWSTAPVSVHVAAAVAAAWTSAQVLLILRELFPAQLRTTATAWALASFLAPLPLMAQHAHMEVAGAALVTTAYRAGFTAPHRRRAIAVVLLTVGLLLPQVRSVPDLGLGLSSGFSLFGERALAIFVDRSTGLAATAPWLLLGIAAIPMARRDPRLAVAGVAALAGLFLALFQRSWETTAVPAYVTVAALPLWTVFVAAALARSRGWIVRLAAVPLIALSAVATFAMAGNPSLALTGYGDGRVRETVERLLGIDPLGWLPDVGRLNDRDLGAVAAALALAGLFAVAAYPRSRPMIDGVVVRPLRRIADARGEIMHMLRADDPQFEKFGEIYFSVVNENVVKGWHLHSRMTLNYAVPSGRIKLVLYDAREGSPTKGRVQEVMLGGDDYQLVRVPPGVWNAFHGLGPGQAIVANCATEPHDPGEILRKPPTTPDIPYEWGNISPVSG